MCPQGWGMEWKTHLGANCLSNTGLCRGNNRRNTMCNATQPCFWSKQILKSSGESFQSFSVAWDFATSFSISLRKERSAAPSGSLNYLHLMFVGLSEVAVIVWPAWHKEDWRQDLLERMEATEAFLRRNLSYNWAFLNITWITHSLMLLQISHIIIIPIATHFISVFKYQGLISGVVVQCLFSTVNRTKTKTENLGL